MIDRRAIAKAWALLDRRERRNALKVLGVMIVSAFASAAMVGSIFPFLSVLANPELIREVPALGWAYRVGGFGSDYGFLVALGLGAIGVIVAANVVLAVKVWALSRFFQMRV